MSGNEKNLNEQILDGWKDYKISTPIKKRCQFSIFKDKFLERLRIEENKKNMVVV